MLVELGTNHFKDRLFSLAFCKFSSFTHFLPHFSQILELGIMGYMSNQPQLLSKIATDNGHGENSPYFDGWKAYDSDPYHPIENPGGVIQMGLAENQVTRTAYSFLVFRFLC